MRIGVLSDTHIPGKARALPERLFSAFAGVEMILHAGDVVSMQVLDDLEALAPVYAVRGNMDPPELWGRLPILRRVEAGGVSIGLIHGHGDRGTTVDRAFGAFAGSGAAAVVFGHSHVPLCERRDGILLFNPGSATDRRSQAQCSYGYLYVENGNVTGEIIHF